MNAPWDVIVVGAGSAGAAFAARSAQAGRRVLLLESGPDLRSGDLPPKYRAIDSRAWWEAEDRDRFVWSAYSAQRTASQAPWRYTRGRGMGGSSLINSIIAIRPPVEDFDEWAAAGCEGWAFDDVLPYFRRLEDDLEFGAEPYHGIGGPVPVHRLPLEEWGPVDLGMRDAALAAGFAWEEDLNAPGATGVSPYPVNGRDGVRVTTNDGYLEPLRGDPNLEIRGDALVDTVLFDGSRAIGVRLAGGEDLLAPEIVLCGGVVGSALILQRSGIGPRELLEPLGIRVRRELPVGRGMNDHVVLAVDLPLKPEHRKPADHRPFNCCVRYSSGMADLTNDLMIISANTGRLFPGNSLTLDEFGGIWVWVNRSFSRGTVEIASPDPLVPPVIRHDLLSDPRDLERLRDAARLTARLIDSAPLRTLCEGDPWQANPALAKALEGTDAAFDAFLLENVVDTNHAASTCAMGPADDGRSVVDPACRVHGIQGLSVIDASVLPHCPRANTHLTAVMVGEAMADRFEPSPA